MFFFIYIIIDRNIILLRIFYIERIFIYIALVLYEKFYLIFSLKSEVSFYSRFQQYHG